MCMCFYSKIFMGFDCLVFSVKRLSLLNVKFFGVCNHSIYYKQDLFNKDFCFFFDYFSYESLNFLFYYEFFNIQVLLNIASLVTNVFTRLTKFLNFFNFKCKGVLLEAGNKVAVFKPYVNCVGSNLVN